jgi:hypothetical protein
LSRYRFEGQINFACRARTVGDPEVAIAKNRLPDGSRLVAKHRLAVDKGSTLATGLGEWED